LGDWKGEDPGSEGLRGKKPSEKTLIQKTGIRLLDPEKGLGLVTVCPAQEFKWSNGKKRGKSLEKRAKDQKRV